MIRKREGVAALLQKDLGDHEHSDKITKLHCLIHQKALRARTTNFKSVMNTVMKAVNVILSHEINHGQFRQVLLEVENEHGDLLYFCNVCWLSSGACLQECMHLEMK